MERETIRRIREAVGSGRLGRQFTAAEVNVVLKIHWAGTFLPKHRVENPGGYTELFVRIRPGVYRLKGRVGEAMGVVFQYGSNASHARLLGRDRLNGHGTVIGPAETVEDYDIAFDVWSRTNRCAAADLVSTPGRKAWGVLYEIPNDFICGKRSDGEKTLAQIEGPNYEAKEILVRPPGGAPVRAVTFLVTPAQCAAGHFTSFAYVSWIVSGLREQGVPEPYVQHVIEVALETNRIAGAAGEEHSRLIQGLKVSGS